MYYYDDKVTMFDEYFSKLKCISCHPHSHLSSTEQDMKKIYVLNIKHPELDIFDALILNAERSPRHLVTRYSFKVAIKLPLFIS